MVKWDALNLWDYVPDEMLEPTLCDSDQVEFDQIYAGIVQARERVASHAHARSGELLAWNENGSRPPLFWCFNNWVEPVLLAHQLSPEQPLYAMHSFHSFTERWLFKGRFTEALANRYLDSVAQVAGSGPVMFGGNCQGAPVAESMAVQLSERSDVTPLLITLDYIAKRAYRGPRIMLFGEHSEFNPFRMGPEPLSYWQGRQGHFAWAILNAAHGGYFREPTVGTVAHVITGMSDHLVRTGTGPRGEIHLPTVAERVNV